MCSRRFPLPLPVRDSPPAPSATFQAGFSVLTSNPAHHLPPSLSHRVCLSLSLLLSLHLFLRRPSPPTQSALAFGSSGTVVKRETFWPQVAATLFRGLLVTYQDEEEAREQGSIGRRAGGGGEGRGG
eukprot:TRINITY_DN796_c0_g1_i3.p3 TRINITY_DN796_c0_g1~~TRINITY_DN796_c0_g1_i3.p3  ORF type:complete len:127 (-),score=20.16 TRINITY_DN796_c0_g1_i3:779-1159(-)